MTRSIKEFNEEIAAKGYTLHANFSSSRWNGMTTLKVPTTGATRTA